MRDAGLIPVTGRSPGEEMATHSSILAWRIPWIEEPEGLVPGVTKSQTWLVTEQQQGMKYREGSVFLQRDILPAPNLALKPEDDQETLVT